MWHWFVSLFKKRDQDVLAHEPITVPAEIWCLVANIKREHPFDPGGNETRIGTRQFRGGAKVYIPACFPGTCDAVVCIGLHRKSRRMVTCVVNVKHVENFRVKLVCDPRVLALMNKDRRCWIATKEEAERWATAFPERQEMWKADDQ